MSASAWTNELVHRHSSVDARFRVAEDRVLSELVLLALLAGRSRSRRCSRSRFPDPDPSHRSCCRCRTRSRSPGACCPSRSVPVLSVPIRFPWNTSCCRCAMADPVCKPDADFVRRDHVVQDRGVLDHRRIRARTLCSPAPRCRRRWSRSGCRRSCTPTDSPASRRSSDPAHSCPRPGCWRWSSRST